MAIQFQQFLFSLFLLIFLSCDKSNNSPMISGTALSLEEIATLPGVLTESSGLVQDEDGLFWSMNDKGGKAELYAFNEQGTLQRTLKISNASNVDWEDLAIDAAGNIFIGDMGNNDNDRQNLKILDLSREDIQMNTSSISATTITYQYNNQTSFPPGKPNRHFDSEALVNIDGRLHLFSKDRSDPFDGITNHYSLAEGANPRLAILQSFFMTDAEKDAGAISGAAMSKDGKKLALISNKKCWVITDFNSDEIFQGTIEDFVFDKNSQIEGVCFGDPCTIYLTDEQNNSGGKKLYRANICN